MERFRGYQSAIRDAGFDCGDDYAVSSDFSQTGGYEACQLLLQRKHDFTAVCCANDNIAVGAMSAIRKFGLKIPKDLSIISIGDISEAKYMHPPLTTLQIPHYEMGGMAVDYIVKGEEDIQNTPEIYPTRMRALGTSFATAWLRLASAIGPTILAFVLGARGITTVFLMFAIVCAAGAVLGSQMIETREKILEDIAP